jgi:hypothetical protein
MVDRWAVRDEQPTHLPPHPSFHQETTGAERINDVIRISQVCKKDATFVDGYY